jgi:serine/threonine-protein kinase
VTSSVTSSNRFPELERFELIEEVGHGGMATVYRARDLRLGREVAVKVIHKHLRENPEVRRRFVSEARAVAKLKHPGIVEVYDVSDEGDEERYLVVELIRGRSLRQLLQEREMLPPEIAASLVALLCEAVQHAHDSGVIHRDIKPENVLIGMPGTKLTGADEDDPDTEPDSGPQAVGASSPAGRDPGTAHSSSPPGSGPGQKSSPSARTSSRARAVVKLTDFGIAKVLDIQGMTSTGQILGSPAHMAPEQIEGGKVGPHTDVFALGVMLYECMVGHLPFEGRNPAQVLRRVLDGSFEPADRERPEVGGRWARIIADTLTVAVDERTSSAEQLAARIVEELDAVGAKDPRTELASYFGGPQDYEVRAAARLVPQLLERGERERRRGSVHGAAADFNRALAYRPGDLAILKRVSSLTSRRLWRQRAARVGAILAVSVVLGGAAYSLARWFKAADPRGRAPTSTAASADTAGGPTAAPSAALDGTTGEPLASAPTAPPSVTTSGTRPVKTMVLPPRTALSALPEPTKAMVRFIVNPGAANFALDGRQVPWLGDRELAMGPHSVRAWMDATNPCCGEVNTSVSVDARSEDQPGKVQIFPINLPIKDASARLSGAPTGGIVTCGNGLTVTAGSTGSVPMTDVEWRGSCTFNPGNKTRGVVLRAGVTTPIAWPGS